MLKRQRSAGRQKTLINCTCHAPAEPGALQGLEQRLPDTGATGLAAGSPESPDGEEAADGAPGLVGCPYNTRQPDLAVKTSEAAQ